MGRAVAGSPEYAFNEYLSLTLTEGIAVCAVVVVVIGMCLRMGMKRAAMAFVVQFCLYLLFLSPLIPCIFRHLW